MLKLNLYILALGYLEKKAFHFMEVVTKNKDEEENKDN